MTMQFRTSKATQSDWVDWEDRNKSGVKANAYAPGQPGSAQGDWVDWATATETTAADRERRAIVEQARDMLQAPGTTRADARAVILGAFSTYFDTNDQTVFQGLADRFGMLVGWEYADQGDGENGTNVMGRPSGIVDTASMLS